jgi:hypothetical protein
MEREEATKIARDMDLRAKAGVWYKCKMTRHGYAVVRIEGDKERVVRK